MTNSRPRRMPARGRASSRYFVWIWYSDHREVLVGAVLALDRQGEQLLVGGAEQVVGALAVLAAGTAVAVLGPAAGGLVVLARQQRREQHLLAANRVHLLADDALDVVAAPSCRAAARCRARARRGGHSRRGPAACGSAPRRRPGRHAGCAGTAWTSAAARPPLLGESAEVFRWDFWTLDWAGRWPRPEGVSRLAVLGGRRGLLHSAASRFPPQARCAVPCSGRLP